MLFDLAYWMEQHSTNYNTCFIYMRFASRLSLCACCIEGPPTRLEQAWASIWACESAYVMVDGLFALQVIECYRIDGLLQQLLDINHPSTSIINQMIFILYFLKRILFQQCTSTGICEVLAVKNMNERIHIHTYTYNSTRDAVWCDDDDYAKKTLT